MKKTFGLFFSVLLFFLFVQQGWALTEKAQDIFERFSPSVYQIQVIDLGSGEKSAIGSGFVFSDDGLFATNYHVVETVLEKPERYRIEYRNDAGEHGTLKIKAINVTNDIAILKGDTAGLRSVSLSIQKLSKGDRIFPMGNPLDLGMTIIEGTYNGLVGQISYQRILLSASLNPGMSGGPAFDGNGKVIGVNVAIKGRGLGYLIPVEYLLNLAHETKGNETLEDWQEVVQSQILGKYRMVIEKLLKEKFSFEKFGSMNVPLGILPKILKCWGQSKAEDVEEGRFVSFVAKWCQSEDDIYLSSGFNTGNIGYSFTALESKSLTSPYFYKAYSEEFSEKRFFSKGIEKNVSEFDCQDGFVKFAGREWKAFHCVRQYKKFPLLYDSFLSFAVLGETHRGHIIQVGLAGVNEELSSSFVKKLLGGIQWVD